MNPPGLHIREVMAADLDGWACLRGQLWPEDADQHPAELKQFFAGRSVDIIKAYVLVDGDDQVRGFMELNIRNFAEGSRSPRVPYVEAWYVSPEHQGQGWGKQFMHKAEQWALKMGHCELASDTEITNQHSIDVHKHLGFVETERVVCLLKQLKP
jgi:aminoglycoside 6'-N-acetyltransferase I